MQRIRHEDHTKNETMLVFALQIKTVLWKCKKFAEEKVRKGVRCSELRNSPQLWPFSKNLKR